MDVTVKCPYEPLHVMHVDSFLTHLSRCKATNKHLFRVCPFSNFHIIAIEQMNDHIKVCPAATKKQCSQFHDQEQPQQDEEEWEQEGQGWGQQGQGWGQQAMEEYTERMVSTEIPKSAPPRESQVFWSNYERYYINERSENGRNAHEEYDGYRHNGQSRYTEEIEWDEPLVYMSNWQEKGRLRHGKAHGRDRSRWVPRQREEREEEEGVILDMLGTLDISMVAQQDCSYDQLGQHLMSRF